MRITKRVSSYNGDTTFTLTQGKMEVTLTFQSRYGKPIQPYISHGSSWSGASSEESLTNAQDLISLLSRATFIAMTGSSFDFGVENE
jgi:hypothetical protein